MSNIFLTLDSHLHVNRKLYDLNCALLVLMQISTTTLEISIVVSWELGINLHQDLAILLLGI